MTNLGSPWGSGYGVNPGQPSRYPSPASVPTASVPPIQSSGYGGWPPNAPGAAGQPVGYGLPGGQGYPGGYGVPGPQPAKGRGALVVLVTVLVVALGAAGGAAYLVLRGEPVKNVTLSFTSPREGFSEQWFNGSKQIWSLDADSAAEEAEDIWVDSVGDWVIREYTTPPGGESRWVKERKENPEVAAPPSSQYTTSVEVYSTKSGQPELQWRNTFPGEAADIAVWRSQLLIGNQLIDLDTQKVKTAPWSLDAASFVTGQGILVCEQNSCAMWKDLDVKVWEQTMPIEGQVVLNKYNQVGDYVVIWNGIIGEARTAILNLATGSAKVAEDAEWGADHPKEEQHPWPHPLADGWYTTQSYAVREGKAILNYTHYCLYDLEGNLLESFDVLVDLSFRVYPWSPTDFTREQARKWLRDGDTTWAAGTVSISPTDAECRSVTVGGRDIDLGEKNSFVQKDKDGKCKPLGRLVALNISGSGPVVVLRYSDPNTGGFIMTDIRNGRTAEKVEIGNYIRHTMHDQTLLVLGNKGKVTAYRPA